MAITVPVKLTSDEEAALTARADAEGVSIESLLHEAVRHLIAPCPTEKPTDLTADQWEAGLVEWLDSVPDLPSLPDEALNRERIYTREDEWR